MYARAYRIALLIVDAHVDESLYARDVTRAHRVEQRRVYHPVVCWHAAQWALWSGWWLDTRRASRLGRRKVSCWPPLVASRLQALTRSLLVMEQLGQNYSLGALVDAGATHHLALEPPLCPSRVTHPHVEARAIMSRAIFVKTGSAGQRYELNVEPANTIAELKQLLVAQVCGRHPSKRSACRWGRPEAWHVQALPP